MSVAFPALRLIQLGASAPLLPRTWKLRIGRRFADVTGARIRSRLAEIARGDAPIVAGPWLGEVGFELLYWVPFLAWFAGQYGVQRERLVVLSRGGTRDWYRHIASRYFDVFDQISIGDFRTRNGQRSVEVGEQKQTAVTAFDRELLAPVVSQVGARADRVLHPSTMFRMFRHFWWGHTSPAWVHQHARFRALTSSAHTDIVSGLPRDYVAVKFYYNDAFPATGRNRAFAREVLHALRDRGPVISLSTGLALDDHEGWDEEESLAAHGIRADLSPATNLALQTAIVANARSWVGTYGGFAYLAPFHRVPAKAYYSVDGGFSQRHLALATEVFGRLSPSPLLSVREVGTGL